MRFNEHSDLKGLHALLSPSQPAWVNDTDDRLLERRNNSKAREYGTRVHAFAAEAISLGFKMPKTQTTLNMYVNDAIRYSMEPEKVLYYSEHCFGTADAIQFYERKHLLRIHDLKTGVIKASMTQLMVYAALFCLEYGYQPDELEAELRIYQNDEIKSYIPTEDELWRLTNKIVHADELYAMADSNK